jgi:hypothetical protein
LGTCGRRRVSVREKIEVAAWSPFYLTWWGRNGEEGGGGVQHGGYLSDGGVGEGVWCYVGALDRQQHARGGDDDASSARHEAVPMMAKQGRAPAGGERTRWRVGRSGDRKTGWAQEE